MVAESDIVLDSFPYGGCNSVHVSLQPSRSHLQASSPSRAQDALLGGTIVLTLEGAVWRNRIAAAMLRRIGLPVRQAQATGCFPALSRCVSYTRFVFHAQELVTTSAGDFVDRAIQLIVNPDLRQQLQAKLIAVLCQRVPVAPSSPPLITHRSAVYVSTDGLGVDAGHGHWRGCLLCARL